MKKSTLITTIAMIVVVVVALSTATYAWFSASSVSTVEVAMTTTATSDWMIFTGTPSVEDPLTPNVKTYTFTSAASEAVVLTPSDLQKGLKAPASAAWANTISVSGTTASVTSQEFLTATRSGSGQSATVKASAEPAVYDPIVLKVSNASGATKSLQVSVVIDAGVSQTTGTLYAAAATTFDINYITTKQSAVATQFTKGYTKCATPAQAYQENSTVTAATPAVDPSTFVSGSSSVFEYSSATAMSSSTYTNFKKADAQPSTQEIAWGISGGEYYLVYTITIADLGSTDSVYLSIYPWIDGWVADNSAGGASFKINFAFTSVAAAQQQNP